MKMKQPDTAHVNLSQPLRYTPKPAHVVAQIASLLDVATDLAANLDDQIREDLVDYMEFELYFDWRADLEEIYRILIEYVGGAT